jgi:hypothetical protein
MPPRRTRRLWSLLVSCPIAYSYAVYQIVDVQTSRRPRRPWGKTIEHRSFGREFHVLRLASADRLWFPSFEIALVSDHVRPVHRAQRHAHRRGNRRLRPPAVAQQQHVVTLVHARMSSTPRRSFQPPQIAFVAFDQLFTPNQMVSTNHIPRPMKNGLRSSVQPQALSIDAATKAGLGVVAVPPKVAQTFPAAQEYGGN